MNLSPANKILFIISFIFFLQNKRESDIGILSKPVLIPKLLKNPPASRT